MIYLINYILIGILFMFLVEFLLNLNSMKKYLVKKIELGFSERTIGILFWPIWVIVFFYYFLKTYLE